MNALRTESVRRIFHYYKLSFLTNYIDELEMMLRQKDSNPGSLSSPDTFTKSIRQIDGQFYSV